MPLYIMAPNPSTRLPFTFSKYFSIIRMFIISVRCLSNLYCYQVVPVPELYLTAVQLRHDKTGAQYLHVAREDTNNVFRWKRVLDALLSSILMNVVWILYDKSAHIVPIHVKKKKDYTGYMCVQVPRFHISF